jgi:hypothetical protein
MYEAKGKAVFTSEFAEAAEIAIRPAFLSIEAWRRRFCD